MKQEIMKLLGWTELEYSNFQFETGLAYLDAYIPGDGEAINALERSRIFWNWWKNHWAQRDALFVHKFSGVPQTQYFFRKAYTFHNDVSRLTKTVYPNGVVLHDSYAKMIDDFNKEVVNG